MPVGPSHHRSGRSSSSHSSSGRSHISSRSSSSYGSRSSYSSNSYSGSYYGGGSITIHTTPRGWAIFGIIVAFIVSAVMIIVGFSKISNNLSYHLKIEAEKCKFCGANKFKKPKTDNK